MVPELAALLAVLCLVGLLGLAGTHRHLQVCTQQGLRIAAVVVLAGSYSARASSSPSCVLGLAGTPQPAETNILPVSDNREHADDGMGQQLT
jgi:hypothetical protein